MAVDPFFSLSQSFPNIPSTTLEDLPENKQTAIANALADPEKLPSHCLKPTGVEELQEIIGHCQENNFSILPCGNQSKLTWGGLGKAVDLVVSSGGLDRIVDHAVADLTITVEAGVKLRDLQGILQPHRQFLPLDPLYHDQATVGGIMATGCAGPWQQRYGGVRDLILGFSFVRWDGAMAKAGGRVVKNVAGYDLMKLFIGSYGTLGFISQVTFRLYPLPSHSQTLFLTGATHNLAEVTQILRRSGLAPTAALLLSAPLSQKLALGNELGLLLRFQNLAPAVQAQIDQVEKLTQAQSLQTRQFLGEEEIELWKNLSNCLENPGDTNSLLCKFGLLPAKAVAIPGTITRARLYPDGDRFRSWAIQPS